MIVEATGPAFWPLRSSIATTQTEEVGVAGGIGEAAIAGGVTGAELDSDRSTASGSCEVDDAHRLFQGKVISMISSTMSSLTSRASGSVASRGVSLSQSTFAGAIYRTSTQRRLR